MARARASIRAALLAASLCLLGAAAPRTGDLEIAHAWARPSAPGQSEGAVYLTIENTGKAEEALIGASTPAAAKAEVHTMKMSGGMMMMRAAASLPVPPGATLVFAPGGNHIMLLGLKAPLKRGENIALTLTFAHQGKVDIAVPVQDAAP